MPDDYPRSAYSVANVSDNLKEFDALLRKYDLDDPQPNPSIGQIMKKHGLTDQQIATGLRISQDIERAKIDELLSLVKSERDLLTLVKAHIHKGNKKVPENYLIFNMTSAHNCPSLSNSQGGRFRFGVDAAPSPTKSSCQAFNAKGKLVCYAWRDEITYPGAFPYRTRQNQLWERLLKRNPEILVKCVRSFRKSSKEAIVAFRFSECGDFPDQESVRAVSYVADQCRRFSVPERITTKIYKKQGKKAVLSHRKTSRWLPGRFVTYCYTARQDLSFAAALHSDLVVMGSDWMDPDRGVIGAFKMVNSKDEPPKPFMVPGMGVQWAMCPMKCRLCQRCVMGLSSRVKNH